MSTAKGGRVHPCGGAVDCPALSEFSVASQPGWGPSWNTGGAGRVQLAGRACRSTGDPKVMVVRVRHWPPGVGCQPWRYASPTLGLWVYKWQLLGTWIPLGAAAEAVATLSMGGDQDQEAEVQEHLGSTLRPDLPWVMKEQVLEALCPYLGLFHLPGEVHHEGWALIYRHGGCGPCGPGVAAELPPEMTGRAEGKGDLRLRAAPEWMGQCQDRGWQARCWTNNWVLRACHWRWMWCWPTWSIL